MKIGLDIGSTTIKCVVLDDSGAIIYQTYQRHYSHIVENCMDMLKQIQRQFSLKSAVLALSGSAGMGLAESSGIPFVQEVYATRVAAQRLSPQADVIIELGGEDAKILFLSGAMEVRMNGSCAGGTGAFIDQMATLLSMSPDQMDEAAKACEKTYTIASRCGVFAKSDIQPLLNQGAQKGDISASIFAAVVNQTIAGLAQGRPIKGNVLYLGGPLTFLSQLRAAFDKGLKTRGVCPENSLYYVALGAAFFAQDELELDDVISRLGQYQSHASYHSNPPLFCSQEEYQAFRARHDRAKAARGDFLTHQGPVHIGIDSGSTTIKVAVIDEEGRLLHSSYQSNNGNPVPKLRDYLLSLYRLRPDLRVASATSTGYGEDLVKSAFQLDHGVVETVAHFTAAHHFLPEVDFVIDIGGQDIKCFQIAQGAISDIFLNEACSSGCGSFLQTFAGALGYDTPEFAKLGLFADAPVDLGSRCTVFMNSSVKQAQKDGASIENISAGLSISVVKNAIYKVIRASSAESLGRHIVVQGGTFHNEAVLRAFERELKCDVIAPDISGLMGAYGAALYGRDRGGQASGILSREQLEGFTHEVRTASCGLCPNNCRLTINQFSSGKRLISGNRCERPVTHKDPDDSMDLYAYKRRLLLEAKPEPGSRGVTIGMPLGLNIIEMLPFWRAFWGKLGFTLVTSPPSDRELYLRGQGSIPSDTVCYPAKLMHGHIGALLDMDVDAIFYPCMTYNIDEEQGDNCYNCPVVAYYPEVIEANCREIDRPFLYDYLGIHRRRDLPRSLLSMLNRHWKDITLRQVREAVDAAFAAYDGYMADVRKKGAEIIERARARKLPIVVLAGRPYHIDGEINHGIDSLITASGAALISEDSISHLAGRPATAVWNQWTYHARLYSAAAYVCAQPDMQLVQLVSFGCGVDAITTDEVREILHRNGKLYTQIKIDEIANLGAVKIRLRSLFAAAEQKGARE